MANVVVIGLQWGDEAKGKVVDYLAQEADYVVRYNGGNNAGHTVVVGEEIFKFHTVPVGVLNEGVTAIVTDGVVLDPAVFTGELEGLKERGITADKIKISGNAHVLMPYHKLLDGLEESFKGDGKIGTTGRGIGPCYADKMSRTGIRIAEFIDPVRFRKRLSQCVKMKNEIITKVFGQEPIDEDAIYNEYSVYAEKIRPYVGATETILFEASRECANIVFEGAHGSLLDIDHGTYPYATSSHCVAGGATIGTGVGPTMIDRVIGVAKAYSTRVGEGPFPTELFDDTASRIRERGKEYGTTTGRPRRCGWLDLVALRFATRINAASCLAVTLLDVLSGFETLKVCTQYDINGVLTKDFPTDVEILKDAKPVFEELPGWSEEITEIMSFDDLPLNARQYLARIAEVTETPICLAGVGRKRSQTIILDPDMMAM
jgi:adenylosuccinate synthase